ncbi:MAG TPA: autotransporter domain-containing protein, partial [Pusillimonas sp.]|uniref:autotransporter domain-containing protein n=1 Tax=Pusillimonas sp. TaxID=3040095 RepID=UPI002C138654
MSRIRQAKALRLTVLTAALITAYMHATPHAAEVVFDHETATLNDSPYSNTFFGLKNGSKVEASGVTINGPGGGLFDGRNFYRNALLDINSGSGLELTNSSITGSVLLDHLRTIAAYDENTRLILENTRVKSVTQGAGTNVSSAGVMVWGGANAQITGGSIETNSVLNHRGLVATNDGTIVAHNIDITTTGKNAHAVAVDSDKGITSLAINGARIKTTGAGAAGMQVAVTNSASGTLQGAGNTVLATGPAATVTGVGARLILSDSTLTTTAGKYGLHVANGGHATLTRGSVTNETTSSGSVGIAVESAGTQVTADATHIHSHTSKGDTTAVLVKGAGAVFQGKDLAVHSSAPGRARGVFAESGGRAHLDGGAIETDGGSFSHAMQADGVGSAISTNNLNVRTTGYAAAAFTGAEVSLNGGTFDVVGTTGVSGWDSAAGFVVGGYAHTPGARLTASNVRLVNSVPIENAPPVYTSWALRVGAGFVAGPQALDAQMTLIDSQVIASGPKRQIAAVQNGSRLHATNSHMVSEQDAGLSLYDNATVMLNGSTVEAGLESFRSSFSNSGSMQSITAGSGSVLVKNSGTLLRVDRKDAGTDGIVNFTLKNGARASGNIVNYADGKLTAHHQALTNFVVEKGAVWAGMIIDDKTRFIDESSGDQQNYETDGSVSMEGSSAAYTQFNGTTSIGGTASVGAGMSVRFNGPTNVGGSLNGLDGSQTDIAGPAQIGGSVAGGAGAAFHFSGTTHIVGSVSGTSGTAFSFSQNAPSSIGGDVDLGADSSISGGSTDNPIQIGGDAYAGAGSVLGGNLFVQGALGGDGGTISPGNSIGVQSYGSSAEFTGAYTAEVNAAGNSDLIIIRSGDFDLSGIDLFVRQEDGTGGYRLNQDYTIVQTDAGSVQNEFQNRGALDDSFAGTLVRLDPIKYGANNVRISLSVDQARVDRSGYSANQNATLDGALSVAGQNAAADAVMLMQPEARKDALSQLSGELHGSTQAALLQNSSLVSRTLIQRMRANLGAGMLPGAPVAQAGAAVPAGAMPTSAAHPLWAQVVGNWSTLNDDGNAAKVTSNTAGLFVGGDAGVGGGWRVGGSLGYTDGRVKVNERSSRSDVSSFTAALYGGNSWQQGGGKLNLLA